MSGPWNVLLTLAQQGGERPGVSDPFSLPFLIVFMVAFIYFFVIRPQKKEADEKKRLLESLKKNDRILTSGGMYGTIVNIKEDEVTVRVDDQNKVKVRFAKSAIAKVVSPDSEKAESKKS